MQKMHDKSPHGVAVKTEAHLEQRGAEKADAILRLSPGLYSLSWTGVILGQQQMGHCTEPIHTEWTQ